VRTVLLLGGAVVVLIGLGAAALFGGVSLWWSKSAPPEAATGWNEPPSADAAPGMVAAAHPLASEAGAQMLGAGGTAADAAVAIQAMLTLVEPQSSGIGGGGFALYYDGRHKLLQAWDGREVAPEGVSQDLFIGPDDQPLGFLQALVGGRSVGVPGVLAMLAALHRSEGRLPWSVLFQPAIRSAEDGFAVTPRLHHLLRRDPVFRAMPAARALYYPDGRALPVGATLRNPQLAQVLRRIAAEGPEAFYEGEVAEAVVQTVKSARQPAEWKTAVTTAWIGLGMPGDLGLVAQRPNPGLLTLDDLEGYQPELRAPVCIDYRARWRVCGFPPPTSGGVTALQILGMLAHFDLSNQQPRDSRTIHLLAEASKLAFADRNRYIGDPEFVPVPVQGLLDPTYLRERARMIDETKAMPRAKAGRPEGAAERTDAAASALPSTSHFSVADEEGNVLSMTTSVENVFGSRLVVKGFVLNNQLTDFAFVPERDGAPVANRVEPGKRPRSSMAPLIVVDRDSGQPVMAVGSPGGSRIIGYVVNAVMAVLDFGLSAREAVRLPHVVNRNGATEVEDQPWARTDRDAVVAELEQLGHEVKVRRFTSGLHLLVREGEMWSGGADPRREGRPVGTVSP
jgi:gamma-glutamyltranspeptidase/glutathione hydrolase